MKKKILLSANSYWNLFNFRQELIKNLHSNKNYELHLLAPPDHKINFFKQMGCKCHIINYKRNKKNFFESIKIFFIYLNFVKKIKPSIFLPFTINGAVTTSAVNIIDVPADKLQKVNTIIIANIDGTNAATVTIAISNDNGSSYYEIASTVSVPADSTLIVVDKNSSIYLDETDLLRVVASANSDLTYTVSGEILDDA